uniref:C3H1-type domain-containing protein n=1 Tax=Myripristis murdjan TaxID=586833 RepID=A0A667WUD6_9TELE
MSESAVLKLICANQGSIRVAELEANGCFDDVRRIISNREKFVCCRSGGEQKVVAKTELRLCKAKVCQGCNNLHLCRKFLLGSCPFSQSSGCQFSHHLTSDHNMKMLGQHGLQDLDRTELCMLLLQNDNFLLPPICFHYNNGGGPFGWCQDGDSCTKLHICEKHLQGYCQCHRAHDFHDPQPLKTLQARGVPSWLFGFLKTVYINKRVLRSHDDDLQQHLQTFSTGDTRAAANYPDDFDFGIMNISTKNQLKSDNYPWYKTQGGNCSSYSKSQFKGTF